MSNTTDSFQASNFENENSDLAENELNLDELDTINGGCTGEQIGNKIGGAIAAPYKFQYNVAKGVAKGIIRKARE